MDGCADDPIVVSAIRSQKAGMAMFLNERDRNKYSRLVADDFRYQDLQADETQLGCSGSGETANCRDAAIEEIFHVISGPGISVAYAKKFGETNSLMTKSMDKARGGKFITVPDKYPPDAIYHYYDKTCSYQCMATEYFYWAVTSFHHGQNAREQDNMREWEASTRGQLKSKVRDMFSLIIRRNKMKLLSAKGILPGTGSKIGAAGTYKPKRQKCASGCALDGTKCGPLGGG
eukprot:CAMPEP_0194338358 /NCGR_PEP_ID=MMETSP0171-20130528/79318_1 /TAXON_ID=218684 /ORGANISM="Corethron pennatum, Strain L29A3" /LENGTH=231 /DNA_ID=CAMNT_0039102455 /DNA_START=259 /DNA_END=950 /DNA_ORIENTATION=+